MKWPRFIDTLYTDLENGRAFNDFRQSINSEQDLTEIIALKIRKLYAQHYGVPDNSKILFEHVTFRNRPTEHDRKAYRKAKENRWVFFHDVFYAPDILIQGLDSDSNILPVEVKLIKGGKQSPSQSIATAIGQGLIYTTKYPQSIVFSGVLRSSQWGRYKFRTEANEIENNFYNQLKNMNVKVILREVGLTKQGLTEADRMLWQSAS